MVELLKTAILSLTVVAVVVPLAFLAALSLPHNSELRQMVMKVCYWGVVLLAVGLIAMPIDVIPDLLFPIGFADDAVYLAVGCLAARKAMKPSGFRLSRN